jgi:hypothetical protein
MTDLLTQAFSEASKLSEQEQDALARWILDELAHEHQWDQAFDHSHDQLARLADEALAEHRAGRTTVLDPDRL